LATLTSVQPAGRFGLLGLEEDNLVSNFKEKPVGDGGWINGGFFVLKPEIFSYLSDDADSRMWEDTLEHLAEDSQLMAYKHHGFWQCMDALRDKEILEQHWKSGKARWKTWE
jgi:glucose-1-phosphate cytidylyltransferase